VASGVSLTADVVLPWEVDGSAPGMVRGRTATARAPVVGEVVRLSAVVGPYTTITSVTPAAASGGMPRWTLTFSGAWVDPANVATSWQTASGSTYTLYGPPSVAGLNGARVSPVCGVWPIPAALPAGSTAVPLDRHPWVQRSTPDMSQAPWAWAVPGLDAGTTLVIHHTDRTPAAVRAPGDTVSAGRTQLAHARFIGADGVPIATGYTVDLASGVATIVSVTGWSQPAVLEHRIEEMLGASPAAGDAAGHAGSPATYTTYDVASPLVRLNRATARAFPAGSMLSSALVLGDLQAQASVPFAQVAWTNAWSNVRIGDPTLAQYDEVAAPIVVSNKGAITERWVLRMDSSTTFSLYGESLGFVGTGTINADFAPLNPATGTAYFIVRAVGWRTGWATGNAVRFNTEAAGAPMWVGAYFEPTAPGSSTDSIAIAIRGDIAS
jgi:hypothetical protein